MANYKSIHTAIGLALMADAETSGIPIELTHIAVGDGNGNPVTEDMITEDLTALYREVYRGTINRVYPDETDPLLRYADILWTLLMGAPPEGVGNDVVEASALVAAETAAQNMPPG